jgi:polysaccharide biosynthesis/export protein
MRRSNSRLAAFLLLTGMFALAGAIARGQASSTASGLTSSAADFRVGPDDVIEIHVVDDEEISEKPIRIGVDGYINLPTVGRLKTSGRTVEELQSDIAEKLRRLIRNPDVTVSVVEMHSQPVTVVGAVKGPGVIQLNGRKTLVEVISLAGGPRDDAGYTARITRQKEFGLLPLPNATTDETGQYSVAEVNLQSIMDARDPAGNIQILPNDLISVPKADLVYVIGDVLKPGSIVLGEQKTVTVLQAISIMSGLGRTAKATEAKILRVTPGSNSRTEIAVNLKAMLALKTNDIPMQADDILYVPTSLRKDLGLKTLEALAGAGATGMIYRLP